MDPQQRAVADEFDRHNTSYKNAVNGALSFSGLKVDFFTQVKTTYTLDILLEAFGSTNQLDVLDIGCGIGNYHHALADKFRSLKGVDVSSSCIDVAAASHLTVDYQCYDGTRLPYADNSFDVALTICVIHHVPTSSWDLFASEMKRVLKPGGMALVFEHNPRNPLTRRVVNRCEFDRDAVLITSKIAQDLFKKQNFETIRIAHILTVPPFNKLLMGIDKNLAWLCLGAQYYLAARKAG